MRVEHNCSKIMLHVLVLIISRNCHTYKQVIIDLFYRYGGHFDFYCFEYLLWDAQGANKH